MKRLLLITVVAACASPAAAPPAAHDVEFAQLHLQRTAAAPTAREPAADRPVAVLAPYTPVDEVAGLLTLPETELEVRDNLSRDDLVALAWQRSPAIRAARHRVEAARTGYAQSADLGDLVGVYRSFLRDTRTRLGPQRSRPGIDMIAPSPNVAALSGEVVRRTIEIEFQKLRAVVRDTVAAAERAYADAARLAAARRVLAADVALQESLVGVVAARLEAGRATQAGLLAFQGRLAALRTELAILEREETVVQARWNRLLARPDDTPVSLDVKPAPLRGVPPDPVNRALASHQEYRAAVLGAERAHAAVRLAETMTLPRMDVGSSRFDDGFPEPGRMVMRRDDFGVREAQLHEMRARLRAAERARDALRDLVRTRVREALFAQDAADRRWQVHDKELVPLADRSFEASRGAYEGARTEYLEVLDAARRLLRARLGRIDARRAQAYARAQLLQAVGER